jgi:hypothetical protein
VGDLDECDLNYASIQYNSRGFTDYDFSNNNTYVYNKMKNYEFKYGAPTLIHTGLEQVVNLYDLHNETKTIYLILITDGETLNKDDFHRTLELYPFNSTELNNVLIKIGTYVTNDVVFEEFLGNNSNSNYNHLKCGYSPLTNIMDKYNFCDITSTSSSISTTSSTTSTTNLTNLTNLTSTTSSTTNLTSTTSSATNLTSTTSSTTSPTTSTNTLTSSTTNTSSIPTTNLTNLTYTTSSATNLTTTSSSSTLLLHSKIYSIKNILIIGTACIICLCSIFSIILLCCNNPNTIIYPIKENIETNDFYNYNNQPRIIQNTLYDPLNIHKNDKGEYIEVNGEDRDSLDDEEDVNDSYNYFKYSGTQYTDF